MIVNRVWQHHFGRGLVGTASNFGTLGERPSHPELLDWLARRFVASGWSLKALHREILLSSTYQQSSRFDSQGFARDPGNMLLWRMNRRRLDVEAWRDAMLAVAGRLDESIGGPSVGLDAPANRRRTAYAAVSRHDLAWMLRLFDFPDPNITSGGRVETTVPLQQLFVLNSEFMADGRPGRRRPAAPARRGRPPTTPSASAGPTCCSTAARPHRASSRSAWPTCTPPSRPAGTRRPDTARPEPLGTLRPGAAGRERIPVRRLIDSAAARMSRGQIHCRNRE